MKLQRRRPLDTVVKDHYWDAIKDCLTDLFAIPDATAASLSLDRRTKVDLAPAGLRSGIFYHREPFEVAQALAESQPRPAPAAGITLDNPTTLASYEQILARHGLL